MLNLTRITELLDLKQLELIKYIYQTQGGDLQRLDYNAAAAALGISRRTVARYIDELGSVGIVSFKTDKLRLSDEVIEEEENGTQRQANAARK